jgi:sugar lactone lactonase YvrE
MGQVKRAGLVVLAAAFVGCGSAAPVPAPPVTTPPPPGMMTTPDAAAPLGQTPASDASAVAVPTADAATIPLDTAPLPAAAADAAPAAPLGTFPLEAIKAAKPALYVSAGTHLEGPSWRSGELFFAADGGGWGLMRVDAAGKLYRYQPKLTPIGTFALADGSLLACDHTYFLVQVFPDGKAGVLPHDGIGEPFCNDVAVDGAGNIFVSARRSGGIYRISPAGEILKVIDGQNGPNGVEVDPTGKFLYFTTGQGGAGRIWKLALPAEGGTTFGAATMVATAGQPDGMAFDAWGNLWVAGWSGDSVYILGPDDKLVTTIGMPGPINLTFGGETVYIEEDGKGVYKLGPVPGLRGFMHPGAARYQIKQMLDLVPANELVR